MSDLLNDLKRSIEGEVRFDAITRKIYSVDASIYEVEPIGVIIPKNRQDIVNAIIIAKRHGVSIVPRGAGTGITGACLGQGLVLDLSKHLNKIIEVDYENEYVVCEPGVVQDQLNEALSEKGYRLGPDTSTGNRATLGGMIGNNAAGAHSLKYGKMVDVVESVDVILSSGETIKFRQLTPKGWNEKLSLDTAEGHIYRTIERIQKEYHDEIENRFPHIPRRASGYNLDELIKSPNPNLAKLIVGSEGSLGIITSVKLKIAKKPLVTGISLIHFHDMIEGMRTISKILLHQPIAVEMIDHHIINMGKLSPSLKNKLGWLQGNPQAVFAVEFEAPTKKEVKEKIDNFEAQMKQESIGYANSHLLSEEEMNNLWAVRKSGLGLLLSKRSYSRAIGFIEDISIAPEKLAEFMVKFLDCLKKHGKEAGVYGHVGPGCMHIRPFINLRDWEDLQHMLAIMEEVSALVLQFGGALSGEHGDGRVRSWTNPIMFGDKLYQAFKEIKEAFDPENELSQGNKVHGQSLLENLRMDPETKIHPIKTFLDFKQEGGFELAVDLCNGNGLCRKKEAVMCPSFQVTGDEYDTTRARAQTLRSIVNGRLPIESFTSPEVYDVLDLCLECKGCKTECPSQVDMAKMKAEFLYQYQQKHGYSLRSKIFGYVGEINKLASPFSSLFNWINRSALGQAMLERVGIATQRPLPQLTNRTFSKWFKDFPQTNFDKKVVLFNDTYTEYNHPEIGQAAVKILQGLGYGVIIPPWQCCGRPLISKGMLEQAKDKAAKLVENLHPYAQQGIPILGLEPSCILTLKDDFTSLLGSTNPQAIEVSKLCYTIDEFLYGLVQRNEFNLPFDDEERSVLLHGHCHQKALVGTKATMEVLKAIPGFTVAEIPSGCCGVAGSFGYETEHYPLSMQIGELKLFPAIRASNIETLLVADGMSCRGQITHGTSRRAFHLVEAIANKMKN